MERKLRWAVFWALLFCSASYSAQPTAEFPNWAGTWGTSQERQSRLSEIEKLATPEAAIAAIRKSVQDLPAQGTEERWKTIFLCHADTLVPRYRATLGSVAPGKALDDTDRSTLKAEHDRLGGVYNGSLFKPSDAGGTNGSTKIFTGHDRPNDCGEISIPPTWTEEPAKEIYRNADLLSQLIFDGGIGQLKLVAHEIEIADGKWRRFFENAIYEGLPWELSVNELAKHALPPLRGTLYQPPSAQLRFAHPVPVMSVSTKGKTTFKENFGVEMIGWRNFDTWSYEPRWGVSALAALRQSADESNGYGLLLTFKSWSLGAVRRDTVRKGNEVQIVVGVDVAKWIQEKRVKVESAVDKYKSVYDKLKSGWSDAKSAAGE